MGVNGLLQYCNNSSFKPKVIEKVDLVEEAKRKGGITILVDLSSFHYIIDSKLQEVQCDNKFLAILGGEYSTLHAYVKHLIEKLRSKDIHLVFYADGSKDSNSREAVQTFGTQTERYNQRRENAENVMNVCNGLKTMDDLRKSRPALRVMQLFRTIEECGCDIKISAEGSVDRDIAKDFITEQAYAILSLDTDFCIFSDCCLITDKMFDLENDLSLEEPRKILSELLKAEKVMEALGIDDHDLMVELSIVAGNDFTGPDMRDIRTRLNLPNFQSIIDWVKQYRKVENNWEMHKAVAENSGFKEAVEHTRKFYKNQSQSAISTNYFPPKVMDINKKIYWQQTIVEDSEFACVCGENALQYLRAHIYRLLLPKNERVVKEYERKVEVNRTYPYFETFVQNSIDILEQQLNRLKYIWPERFTALPNNSDSNGVSTNSDDDNLSDEESFALAMEQTKNRKEKYKSPKQQYRASDIAQAVPSRKEKNPSEMMSAICYSAHHMSIVSQEEFKALRFPLVDYDFKLKCQECENENTDKEHLCNRDLLFIKNIARSNNTNYWEKIRCRPEKEIKIYKKCEKVSSARKCHDECSYAHSDDELHLWVQDKTKKFSIVQFTKQLKELNIKDAADMEKVKNVFRIYEMLLTTNKTVGQVIVLHVIGKNPDIDAVGTAVSQITCNAEHIVSHVCKLWGNALSGGSLPGSVKELIESLIKLIKAVSSQQESKYLPIAAKEVWVASDKIISEFDTRKTYKMHQESKKWKQIHFDLLIRRVCRQFVDMRASTAKLVNFSKRTDDGQIICQKFQVSMCMLEALCGQYGNAPRLLHEVLDSMNKVIDKFCNSTDQTSARQIESVAEKLNKTIIKSDDAICKMMSQSLKYVTENYIASLRQKVWAQLAVFITDMQLSSNEENNVEAKVHDNSKLFDDCLMLASLLVIDDSDNLQQSKDLFSIGIPEFVTQLKSANTPEMFRNLTSHLQSLHEEMIELVGQQDYLCKMIFQELLVEGSGQFDEEDKSVSKIKNMQETYRRKAFKFMANSKGYKQWSQMSLTKKKLFISLQERSITLREHYIVGELEDLENDEDDRKLASHEREIEDYLSGVKQHMEVVESLFTDSDEPNIDAVKCASDEICSGIEKLKATIQYLHTKKVTEVFNALVGAVIDLLSAVQPWSNPVLAVNDTNLPTWEQVDKKDIPGNRQHFHYIMSHFESAMCIFLEIYSSKKETQEEFRNGTTWFKCCSGKDAFKLYILRYFLRLNWERNLHVTKNEFEALVALVFCNIEEKEKECQAICLRPTTRCLTLGSWFQNVYKHAFYYLGYLLYLAQDFPEPREVFCGSAWIVFFVCNQDNGVYESESEDVKKKLLEQKETIRNILEQNRHCLQKVTKDIY